MRKNYFRLAAAVIFVITLSLGCRKDYSGSIHLPPGYKALIVDSLEAVSIASRITHENMFDLTKPDAHRKIESGIMMRDAYNNPAYYIFSFTDTGFIIISGDRNLNPVLAFSNTSKIRPGKVSPGMYNWLQKTQEAVEIVRKGWYDNSQSAARGWAYIDQRLQSNPAGRSREAMRPPPDDCNTTTYLEVGPLLPVTWGQGCTYNSQCPPATNGPCGFSVTGCVATAMAQVMAYWQRPTSYSWAGMPFDFGNGEVARLMRDAGNAVNMSYSALASGAAHSMIDDAFKNTFGYRFSNDVGYSRSEVVGDLQSHHPVILSGFNGKFTSGWWIFEKTYYLDGHEWVCDGYRIWTNPCETTVFLHMNWGWHELFREDDHSGWFWDANWTIYDPDGNLHFQYNKRAIVDIIP